MNISFLTYNVGIKTICSANLSVMKVAEDGYEERDVHCKPLNFVHLQIIKVVGIRNGGNRWLHGRYTINSEVGARGGKRTS